VARDSDPPLDALGAVLDLEEVDLDLDAIPGAGNLLGNLLCTVAGLLDPGSPLSGLTDGLVAQLVNVLNGLIGAPTTGATSGSGGLLGLPVSLPVVGG
jgi:hypothetical protein